MQTGMKEKETVRSSQAFTCDERTVFRGLFMPFQLCRVVTDSVCVIAGIVLCLLSGMGSAQIFGAVGIGTVITAFCMGPLIAFFNRTVARPLLGISAEVPQK